MGKLTKPRMPTNSPQTMPTMRLTLAANGRKLAMIMQTQHGVRHQLQGTSALLLSQNVDSRLNLLHVSLADLKQTMANVEERVTKWEQTSTSLESKSWKTGVQDGRKPPGRLGRDNDFVSRSRRQNIRIIGVKKVQTHSEATGRRKLWSQTYQGRRQVGCNWWPSPATHHTDPSRLSQGAHPEAFFIDPLQYESTPIHIFPVQKWCNGGGLTPSDPGAEQQRWDAASDTQECSRCRSAQIVTHSPTRRMLRSSSTMTVCLCNQRPPGQRYRGQLNSGARHKWLQLQRFDAHGQFVYASARKEGAVTHIGWYERPQYGHI